MKLSQARAAIPLLAVLVSCSGCSVINRIRAKNELNEAARTYKEGHFDEAEQHSKRALELDPNQKNAPAFIAGTVYAQYKPGVESEANKGKGREAVDAYKAILKQDPKNELAYKTVAGLLGALKEDENHHPDPPDEPGKGQREWVAAHAADSRIESPMRSEAYTVLASKDWDCSYKITESTQNKATQMKDNRALLVYKKPQAQKDFDDAKMCVTRGLEEAEHAIQYDPNNESAWSYKTNLLREAAKLAEMDGKPDQKTEYNKQADEAQKQTTAISDQKKKEEAKKTPSPPAT
jgi:tetratricopeptide (TPR) repeat protein